jgi:hypothetical protein
VPISAFFFALTYDSAAQLLCTYNCIAFLDSTHETCFLAVGRNEKAFLYSIVLKNLVTGAGVPAAFMITPSKVQCAISDFLSWLRTDLGFWCKNWMINCSPTEVAGILSGAGTNCIIFFCFFHVIDALIEQSKKKLLVRA